MNEQGTAMGDGQAGIDWAGLHSRLAAAMQGLERGFEPDAAEVARRLRLRAERLAQATLAPAVITDRLRLLHFTLDGQDYALDSALVREVCGDLYPTPVPNVPAWVSGIVYLRGEILAVVDFTCLTGHRSASVSEAGPVVILHQQGRSLGLAVEAIAGLSDVARDSLGAVPTTVQGNRRYYLGMTEQGQPVLDGIALFENDGLPGLTGPEAGAEG